MGTIAFEVVQTGREADGIVLVKWPKMTVADVGTPYKQPRHTDRSVHVTGDFGGGGAVIIEGSLEITPTSYATLNDPQGNPLNFSVEKIESVLENVTNIRPRCASGDGDTLLDVFMLMSK